MNRGRYFTSKSTKIATNIARRPMDDDGWFETDGMDHLSREVFETMLPDSYDTGLLDSKGAPIHRSLERNGIGFRADVWWDDSEG